MFYVIQKIKIDTLYTQNTSLNEFSYMFGTICHVLLRFSLFFVLFCKVFCVSSKEFVMFYVGFPFFQITFFNLSDGRAQTYLSGYFPLKLSEGVVAQMSLPTPENPSSNPVINN